MTSKPVFSQTVQSQLLAKATLRKEPKGAILFRRGEPSLGVFLVRTGSIRLRLESKEGEAILDRTVTRDAIVGLPATLCGGRYSLTALTLEETELAFVDRKALLELVVSDPDISFAMMHVLGEEIGQMREVLASVPSEAIPEAELSSSNVARLT